MIRGRLMACAVAASLALMLAVAWSAGGLAAEDEKAQDGNPYLAAEGLSPADLAEFIDRMLRKPETLRKRPGFAEAVLDAADRLLAARPATAMETVALSAKFEVLNQLAILGDDAANKSLVALAQQYLTDPREKIAAAARLHDLEHRAYSADETSTDELPKILAELKEYFTGKTLDQKHLRLASNTVRAINLLPEEAREKHFRDFGTLLARSSDKKLAKYGRDIARIKQNESELVGQDLEVEGQAVDRSAFDWKSYRGKVVLVDFWATWCGPCRAELPNVKANYEKYHAKGFEIVAISLDQDRETLETFLSENDIPWVNLFDENSTGWENPVATKYGIKAIPAAILVGKDGKVITTSARGPTLGQQLEKLLGK